jgi:hypothetical protein
MRKILALSLGIFLFVMVCDIPALPGSLSDDPYKAYNEYRTSLLALQQDTAQLHLELQQKNPEAVYHHMLQVIEDTAALIGNAEVASRNTYDGFQGSLRGHLELLFDHGLTEKQKTDLLSLGYTEEDIGELLESLAYYNDYHHNAVEGFTPEQVHWFSSMGLTDAQIFELQTTISNHYTQIHTVEEELKQHQKELLYIQLSLSVAALKVLLDQENKGKNTSDGLENAEEKLLEAIKTVSEDQSSLEHVKAFSKQVYKAAEQKIRKGEPQYMVDFFTGLQVHCGALTALSGDTEFGVREIKGYESILSACLLDESIQAQSALATEELLSPDADAVLDFVGQVEESDEDNNAGYIIVIVREWGTRLSYFAHLLAEWGVPALVQQLFMQFLEYCIDLAVGAGEFVVGAAGVIFTLITTAPPVGGSWVECVVDCMTEDPSGTFAHIYEDKDTIATIEAGTNNKYLDECERTGYIAVYIDAIQIVYTIAHASRVYRSPNNHYFYYRVDYSSAWVVEVEFIAHECCGRVVRAYRVDCTIFTCGDISYDSILEQWVLCDNFTLVWMR